MSHNDVSSKTRRKKLDVPIHYPYSERKHDTHKTFSANFNARKKHKNVEFTETNDFESNNVSERPDEDNVQKLNRKQLNKEIDRLRSENLQLIDQLNSSESVSLKKVTKLREKLTAVGNFNSQVVNENQVLRNQYEQLMKVYEDLRLQLEEARQCKSCDDLKSALESSSKDYGLLRATNKELLEDIDMLKNVVYRLNLQLERYQETIRQSNPNCTSIIPQKHTTEPSNDIFTEEHKNHSHIPISWGKVNAHTLAPLLNAYEETISEKNDLLEKYEMEFARFSSKLKEIAKENEALHSRLTEDKGCSKKLSEELDAIKVELNSAKEQNDVLIKKCALKQDKVEEILKCYERKVEQLQRDYEVVHEEYCKSRSEVVALKEKNKSIMDAQVEFKREKDNYIPIAAHTASVNECKRLYEELKEQYENEKGKLRNNVTSLNEHIIELNNKISTLNSEKLELESKIKSLEKHIKKAETKYLDLEHSLNEVQVSRSACRKQLHKAMNFAKDLVTEQEALLKALNQRHLESKVAKKLGCDIASRMDSLKMQLKTVQRDAWQELETVEERLQEQDSLITTMKHEHCEEVERLKEIIREKEIHESVLNTNASMLLPVTHYSLFRERNVTFGSET